MDNDPGKSSGAPCTWQDTFVADGWVDGQTLLVSSNFSGHPFSGFLAGSFSFAPCLTVCTCIRHIQFCARSTDGSITSPFQTWQPRARETGSLKCWCRLHPSMVLGGARTTLHDGFYKHAVTRGVCVVDFGGDGTLHAHGTRHMVGSWLDEDSGNPDTNAMFQGQPSLSSCSFLSHEGPSVSDLPLFQEKLDIYIYMGCFSL